MICPTKFCCAYLSEHCPLQSWSRRYCWCVPIGTIEFFNFREAYGRRCSTGRSGRRLISSGVYATDARVHVPDHVGVPWRPVPPGCGPEHVRRTPNLDANVMDVVYVKFSLGARVYLEQVVRSAAAVPGRPVARAPPQFFFRSATH